MELCEKLSGGSVALGLCCGVMHVLLNCTNLRVLFCDARLRGAWIVKQQWQACYPMLWKVKVTVSLSHQPSAAYKWALKHVFYLCWSSSVVRFIKMHQSNFFNTDTNTDPKAFGRGRYQWSIWCQCFKKCCMGVWNQRHHVFMGKKTAIAFQGELKWHHATHQQCPTTTWTT